MNDYDNRVSELLVHIFDEILIIIKEYKDSDDLYKKLEERIFYQLLGSNTYPNDHGQREIVSIFEICEGVLEKYADGSSIYRISNELIEKLKSHFQSICNEVCSHYKCDPLELKF